MKTAMATAIAMLASLACAKGQTSAEVQADGNVTACFEVAVAQLDDGKSDARTVATAVAAQCNFELRRLVAMRRQLAIAHPEVSASLTSRVGRDAVLDRATTVVLGHRANRQSGSVKTRSAWRDLFGDLIDAK